MKQAHLSTHRRIHGEGWITARELCSKFNVSKSWANQVLKEMYDNSVLKRRETLRCGRPCYEYLTKTAYEVAPALSEYDKSMIDQLNTERKEAIRQVAHFTKKRKQVTIKNIAKMLEVEAGDVWNYLRRTNQIVDRGSN